MIRVQIAQQLQKLREEKGLSPYEIAMHCDLSAENISRIEKSQALSINKYIKLIKYHQKHLKIILE